jgi:hypothetical protein
MNSRQPVRNGARDDWVRRMPIDGGRCVNASALRESRQLGEAVFQVEIEFCMRLIESLPEKRGRESFLRWRATA